jgi:hypothetical protein
MGGFGVGGMVSCGLGVDRELGVDEGGSDGERRLAAAPLAARSALAVVGGWSGFSGFQRAIAYVALQPQLQVLRVVGIQWLDCPTGQVPTSATTCKVAWPRMASHL